MLSAVFPAYRTGLFGLLKSSKESVSRMDMTSAAKPAIAVLPFDNLSPDPDHEYFSDGITNDIITDLSKFKELSVVASNTVFRFKGKSPDIKALGEALRVRYVLEGSVQKTGHTIRINAQLIETSSGNHIWAQRYNRQFEKIFELQDEIIKTIVGKLAVKVHQAELKSELSKSTESLAAYDYYLRGYHHFFRRSREDAHQARHFFSKAIEIDPDFSSAYVGLAKTRTWAVNMGYTEFPNAVLKEALNLAQKAVQLDDASASARAELGYIYMRFGEYDIAKRELEKAIALNPNDWISYRHIGGVLLYSGQPEQSLEWFDKMLAFDPYLFPGIFMNMGIANYLLNDNEKALYWLKTAATKWPDFLGCHLLLASIYGNTGQLEKAAEQKDKILKLSPFFRLSFYGQAYRNPSHREKIVSGLRKAGLR